MPLFNEITSRKDLADILGMPLHKLTHILYVKKPDSFYKTFEIPKKNGETRLICAPRGDLKQIQKKLAQKLYEHMLECRKQANIVSNISHAFEKEKSTKSNAQIHRNKRFVLNVDLVNFFDSFHFGRVQGFFEKNKHFSLPRDMSIIIAQMVCYNGRLPQGAPTSPIITNLIFQICDMRILRLSKKYRLDYSRYADDLTFSTNDKHFTDTFDQFIRELSIELEKNGFSLNPSKTRLMYRDSRQEVTGLVVNKKLNINRDYVRQTKAMANKLYRTGAYSIMGASGDKNQLEGRFAYIDQLDKYNNSLNPTEHKRWILNGREKEYRKFIFFKYFFDNESPIVITEGPTDIRYIKAALMKLHDSYPCLIEKSSSGYNLKIRFLRRSRRFNYFFGLSPDGGDSMKNLLLHFTGKDRNTPNLYEHFCRICEHGQKSAVIFLYDNERQSNKPLKKLLDSYPDARTALQIDLYCQLPKKSKTHLLTIPLVRNKTECEIEDLLPNEVLDITLGGKTFSRKDSFDKNRFFGKEILSKYVLNHYESIDFSAFVPLLDALSAIVENSRRSEG